MAGSGASGARREVIPLIREVLPFTNTRYSKREDAFVIIFAVALQTAVRLFRLGGSRSAYWAVLIGCGAVLVRLYRTDLTFPIFPVLVTSAFLGFLLPKHM